ncbi:MAG TPA: C25 family cysteine peptidase [Chitinophagaceae bacterium]
MRKILLIWLLLFTALCVQSQAFNNEWIDYNKTYYKFKVGRTGLYRISQNTLPAELKNLPAEQFQLWRNGAEIPVYTSVPTGALPVNGYIEFWGERNDGKPDRALYKNPASQLSDALSLETDTAAYFLTVNSAGTNLRIINAPNDVANNTLPPEPYFMYDYRYNYQRQINPGRAVNYGEYVYSSTYDVGEFWASNDIQKTSSLQLTTGNLYVATGGPAVSVNAGIAGNSFLGFDRTVKVQINGTSVINKSLPLMNAAILSDSGIAPSLINTSTVNIVFSHTSSDATGNDRIAVGFVDINYPRLFNFDGQSNFEFSLPPTAQGNYLEISNFNGGAAIPVLYDLTNGKRYTANTDVAGIFRFALPPGAVVRRLVLVSEDASNVIPVNNLIKRNFVDYSNAVNQGDYLIISNKIIFSGSNILDQYAQYRNGISGGSFNSKIIDIDELVDQFAFGIKKHPLSIKNFLRFARNRFAAAPKFAFLVGKAVTYNEYRLNENSPNADKLNLVPTFGWPASDDILGSDSFDPISETSIGRLAVIRPEEVQIYFDKIKLYEQKQQSAVQTIDEKAWMKTVVHVVGANDASLDYLIGYQNNYKNIIEDTFYGANVFSFNRLSTGPETPVTQALMTQLFNNGISIINYFGHSAATRLDYNLNSPEDFDNYGKYPMFMVSGCNAGNIYSYDTSRFSVITSLSENYVLAKDKGSIGFIASSHFGVANYLDIYNQAFYESLTHDGYGNAVSINMRDAAATLINTRLDSTTRYLHAEENVLHGDPALKINYFAKPDFAVEESKVIIDPAFISVANNSFNVKVYFYNIGKAEGDSVAISVKRRYPDNSIMSLVEKQIVSVRFIDSIALTIPIVASRDIGANALIVSIDDPKKYDELSELNNSVTKTFFIYEDELKPIYPYNFSIVNKPNIKLIASTANPLAPARQYIMELDTTELFNSPLKATQTVTLGGGIIEFTPGVAFADSTVYYWRVAPVAANGNNIWNTSSFVYLPGSSFGYNQSHLYQHLKSSVDRIYIDSFSRKWLYWPHLSALTLINAVFPFFEEAADFQVQVNGQTISQSACLGHSVIFNVFDPVTLKPFYNQAVPSTNPSGSYGRFMGSAGTCNDLFKAGTQYNFEFSYMDTSGRRKMRDFMDWVPDGYIVTARLVLDSPYASVLVDTWKKDQSVYGRGNTAYDRFKDVGFAGLDDFTFPRTWEFVYKKHSSSLTPEYKLSEGLYDQIELQLNITSPDTLGYITSPLFGPAASWKQVKWRGVSSDTKPGDAVNIDVIGVAANGAETVLYTLNAAQQDFDISSVSVSAYPYIKLHMRNADSINLTPYQLRYWRILYTPVPEGALAPNILYTFKDTLALGEKTNFAIAFRNVSDVPFADSIKVNMIVYDANNVANNLSIPRLKKLNPGDTATIIYPIDSKIFNGNNTLFLDVNPENAQPEQYHFNNFLYKNFSVSTDNYKPVLDVTFDGIHILNNDIVSAQPHILVKLKDESKFLLLDDTSLFKIQLQYPDGSLRRFYFNTDTLRFTPATTGSADNTASVDFTPYLPQDGTYQLLIHAQDKTGNPAGNADYSVSFQVYNKPMISNMFNYPNPFTTSTAFVFTVTGSQVPQNIRIQILTITGKIVREITKEELGPLHIGRNITEFKWDGTDQYGQKLANGVYLYRVITNLNGSKLSKFPTYDANGNEVNTDQYFNKGYGKMYLMR